MTEHITRYDLVGIGNALVDILNDVEDHFLKAHSLPRGSMNLVDSEQSSQLYNKLPTGLQTSGGSCANTMVGFAQLGGKGAYLGKINQDALGAVFAQDMEANGVACPIPAASHGPPTGRCIIMVSPDAQRTMATYLGAAVDLNPEDIPEDTIQTSKVLYMEGYLFDRDAAKQAFIKASKLAHKAGRKVSLSLSDPFCVDRHRDDFQNLVANHIDILFANEEEIKSLYQSDTFDAALQRIRPHCEIACLTRGAQGSVILAGDQHVFIEGVPVGDALTDTTGAGDQYAAGFLYGYTKGFDLKTAGMIASIAGAEVVSHYGARPKTDLRTLIAEKLDLKD